MKIEKIEELNLLIRQKINQGQNCILAIKDNKSDITIQSVIVKHPIDFLRNLNEYSNNLRIPVSDMSLLLVGYISSCFNLEEVDDIVEISPYVYFKRPEEVNINVGSDDSNPSVES